MSLPDPRDTALIVGAAQAEEEREAFREGMVHTALERLEKGRQGMIELVALHALLEVPVKVSRWTRAKTWALLWCYSAAVLLKGA